MIEEIKNINLQVYYRGLKIIKFDRQINNILYMTNNDKFVVNNNDIFLNDKLISNDHTLTGQELLILYKSDLINRKYKIV